MTDHAPAFLLWMKLTDSKSFMNSLGYRGLPRLPETLRNA